MLLQEILSAHRKWQRSRKRVQPQQDVCPFTKTKLISQNSYNFSILTLQRVGFLTFYNKQKSTPTTKEMHEDSVRPASVHLNKNNVLLF